MVGLILGFKNRTRHDPPKGLGKRFIQLMSVVLILPIIAILSILGIIEAQLLGGLLGAIIGYTLSDLAKDEKDE